MKIITRYKNYFSAIWANLTPLDPGSAPDMLRKILIPDTRFFGRIHLYQVLCNINPASLSQFYNYFSLKTIPSTIGRIPQKIGNMFSRIHDMFSNTEEHFPVNKYTQKINNGLSVIAKQWNSIKLAAYAVQEEACCGSKS